MVKLTFRYFLFACLAIFSFESCTTLDDTDPDAIPVFAYDSFDDFMIKQARETQVFTMEADAETVISGAEGSEITIPANAFSLNGELVTGEIMIHLNELFSIKELFLLNKSTVHNDILLEMHPIKIEATQGDEKLDLMTDMEVKIPALNQTDNIDDINLYYGNNNAIIDNLTWTLDNESLVSLSNTSSLSYIAAHDQWQSIGKVVTNNTFTTIRIDAIGENYLEIRGYLIFKNLKSVIRLDQADNVFSQENIPVGEIATVVLLGFNGFELVMASKEVDIINDLYEVVDLKITSENEVLSFINNL